MRTGLIAQKVGMSCLYNNDGSRVPVTLLLVEDCEVVQVKTDKTDGYTAVQVGVRNKKKNISNPLKGHYAKNKVEPKSKLVEFRVDEKSVLKSGDVLVPSHFIAGQCVDVRGITIGKGFAGVMKRHNFRGLEASHGVSVTHRSHGSTGQRQDPGRVFKNKKMAGHMGVVNVTVQNLKIVNVDDEKGIILVKGAIPGAKGSFVTIRDSVKKGVPLGAPFPAGLKQKTTEKTKAVEAQADSSDASVE